MNDKTEAKELQVGDTMNPYSGVGVRQLQEDLYKVVVLALGAMERADDREAYYFIRCGYDIISVLRPGYHA